MIRHSVYFNRNAFQTTYGAAKIRKQLGTKHRRYEWSTFLRRVYHVIYEVCV